MYASTAPSTAVVCGVIGDRMPERSLHFNGPQKTAWDTMEIEDALARLELMSMSEVPSLDDFIHISKTCKKSKNTVLARRLQTQLSAHGLETHGSLGNYLVPMFVECGVVPDAQQAFYKLSDPNDYSWSSLVQGYVNCRQFTQAFDLYGEMKINHIYPGKYASVALLKACAKLKYIERGQELYGEIVKMGCDDDLFAYNSLLDMYAKGGRLAEAQDLFDMLPTRDIVSWNCLVSGYLEHGLGEEALSSYEKMQAEDLDPTPVTFVCGLKASSSMKAIRKGQTIHFEIVKDGYEQNTFIGSTIIDMYSKCGSLEEAKDVFDELLVKDVVAWTALISGYVEHEFFEEAFQYLEQMQCLGVQPNEVTYICALKACSSTGITDKGLVLHEKLIEEGFESAPSIGSILVGMYAKCGSLLEAQDVFDTLTCRDVVSWTALISGYAEHGLLDEAMLCIEKMQVEGMSPDPIMFLCILKTCGSTVAADKGREMHLQLVQEGFECDLFVANTLVDMYGKCGLLEDAQEVFYEMPLHDVISWNALIAGYAQHGLSQEAQKCWEQMLLDGVPANVVSWNTLIQDKAVHGENEAVLKLHAQMQEQGLIPDSVTLVAILTASGNSADSKMGKRVHAQIHRNEHVGMDAIVHTALVDMYAKCGRMVDAQQVFDELPRKDLVGWSALSMGYARQGEFGQFFSLLERMIQQGLLLDDYSLHSVLTTCSHSGLVGKGQILAKHISEEVGFGLSNVHHNCMVDLLGRAGRLDEAAALLEKMPYQPSSVTWSMVLGACQNWGNAELATGAFGEGAITTEDHSALFVLMSNMAAQKGEEIEDL
ncbi:hypothetical protein GOP47_0004431 [Adiantum capillus-veneris]|uniref:Pentatricopeptide repeat-containing protein n=1 Tax=Adiantum capillus-veneris TaxID=13818 RepID=A0A9D4ZMK9_ADICA|nr:hypothetical protein GOP47_0004431 [Adiantum capillus-veneris]